MFLINTYIIRVTVSIGMCESVLNNYCRFLFLSEILY